VLANHDIGDFIENIFPSNRKGGSLISFSITRSKNCIDYCELVELPLNGKKFLGLEVMQEAVLTECLCRLIGFNFSHLLLCIGFQSILQIID
jgi:hypothetical protein